MISSTKDTTHYSNNTEIDSNFLGLQDCLINFSELDGIQQSFTENRASRDTMQDAESNSITYNDEHMVNEFETLTTTNNTGTLMVSAMSVLYGDEYDTSCPNAGEIHYCLENEMNVNNVDYFQNEQYLPPTVTPDTDLETIGVDESRHFSVITTTDCERMLVSLRGNI